MPQRVRTFIGIELSGAVRQRLAALQEELAAAAPDAKWVEPENIHLTLKFLGDVDDRELYAVCKTAQEAVADFELFDIAVTGVGAFPNAARPRVLWAGVSDGATQLVAISEALDRAFSAEGYPREDRPYTPHITLARVRRGVPGRQLAERLDARAAWRAGSFTAREVLIMSSHLGSDGPHYAVLGRGPFTG